jgi:tetratricopeptide (TPR) repeat protein
MNKTLIALTVLLVGISGFNVLAVDIDSIDSQYQAKTEKLKKSYEKALKKLKDQTVKKYEDLLKTTMRAGDLDKAVKIRKRINEIKNEISPELKEVINNQEEKLEADETMSKASDRITTKEIKKRFKIFYGALSEDKIDEAMKYVDPEIRKYADSAVLKGHLKVLSGYFQVSKIGPNDIGVEEIVLGKKRKDAKVTGKFRAAGAWHTSKDLNYWVKRKGEWYLGDEKKLKDFKEK